MDVNQIAFIIIMSFGILAFLYLLGCESEESTVLNEYLNNSNKDSHND